MSPFRSKFLTTQDLPQDADGVTKAIQAKLSSAEGPVVGTAKASTHAIISEKSEKFSAKYESDVMKSFLEATTPSSATATPTKASGESSLLVGSLKHTKQDVVAKENFFKNIEVKREDNAKKIEQENQKQVSCVCALVVCMFLCGRDFSC